MDWIVYMDIIQMKIKEIVEIEKFLQEKGEIDYSFSLGEFGRKYIILSIGSYIEDKICQILKNYFDSFNNEIVSNFTKKFAIERNFYKMFDWNADTITHFLNFFGNDFKINFEEKVKKDRDLADGIQCFISLIKYRNNLIHRNVLSQQLDLSITDINKMYKSAYYMINVLESELLQYVESRIICCQSENLEDSLESLAKCYLVFK